MTPRIALPSDFWRWATWRTLEPEALDAPARPYDRDACLTQLAKARTVQDLECVVPNVMTREEARFWTEVFLLGVAGKKTAASLKAKPKLPALSLKAVLRKLSYRVATPLLMRALRDLFSPLEVVEAFVEHTPLTNGYDGGGNVLNGIRAEVMPYVTNAQRAALRKKIAPRVKKAARSFPVDDFYHQPPGPLLVATMLGGFDDDLSAILDAMPDDLYRRKYASDAYQVPQLLIFGLSNPFKVEEQMRRLQLKLSEPHFVRAWLAHTENAALDYVAETIINTKKKSEAVALAKVLAVVVHPDNEGPMRSIARRSKAKEVGVAWLNDFKKRRAKRKRVT